MRRNPFGLYDILGNVEELVQDCWFGYPGLPHGKTTYQTVPADPIAVAPGDPFPCNSVLPRGERVINGVGALGNPTPGSALPQRYGHPKDNPPTSLLRFARLPL